VFLHLQDLVPQRAARRLTQGPTMVVRSRAGFRGWVGGNPRTILHSRTSKRPRGRPRAAGKAVSKQSHMVESSYPRGHQGSSAPAAGARCRFLSAAWVDAAGFQGSVDSIEINTGRSGTPGRRGRTISFRIVTTHQGASAPGRNSRRRRRCGPLNLRDDIKGGPEGLDWVCPPPGEGDGGTGDGFPLR